MTTSDREPEQLHDPAAAVDAFLAMELHVADCGKCARNDVAFSAAMRADDMDAARQLSHGFCDEMSQLAVQLHSASKGPSEGASR